MRILNQIAKKEELVMLLEDFLAEAGAGSDCVRFEIESIRAEIDKLKLIRREFENDTILNKPMDLLDGALAREDGGSGGRPVTQLKRSAVLGDQAAGRVQGTLEQRCEKIQAIESI